MTDTPPTGTLLTIRGTHLALAAVLGQVLQDRLGQPVVVCPADHGAAPIVGGIRTLVAAGARRLVILPLDCAPERAASIVDVIRWASRRWPFLAFHAAAALNWLEWAACARAVAAKALGDGDHTAIVLAAPGGPQPLENAQVAQLAHLLREASTVARVDYAFLDGTKPDLQATLDTAARLGLRRVVVVPWLLDDAARDRLAAIADVTVAGNVLKDPLLLDLLAARHQAALADLTFLAPTWAEIQADIARDLGPAAHAPGQGISAAEEAQLRALDDKINALLPPQYQGRYDEVRPESMGSAALKRNGDGTVAWDEMWTSFCDLALAGGPPHRGTLLEAPTAQAVAAAPDQYRAVVAELERGIRLVTGLPTVTSAVPGWVGVRCDDADMAIWLLRAIIVENVMVRREGDVLYLPAGPAFVLRREIKNVVTVVAKTVHYWSSHRVARADEKKNA